MSFPFQLVSAVQIRDLLLPLLRTTGSLEDSDRKDSPLRLLVLDRPPWKFLHWTPFNALSAGEASSPGYRRAVARQRSNAEMPYGLEISYEDDAVLSLIWSEAGSGDVLHFQRGAWEQNLRIYVETRQYL